LFVYRFVFGGYWLVRDRRISFREPVLFIMTPGHLFFGLSFALELLLPLDEFILTPLGHLFSPLVV